MIAGIHALLVVIDLIWAGGSVQRCCLCTRYEDSLTDGIPLSWVPMTANPDQVIYEQFRTEISRDIQVFMLSWQHCESDNPISSSSYLKEKQRRKKYEVSYVFNRSTTSLFVDKVQPPAPKSSDPPSTVYDSALSVTEQVQWVNSLNRSERLLIMLTRDRDGAQRLYFNSLVFARPSKISPKPSPPSMYRTF